jgi:hypothetical protein
MRMISVTANSSSITHAVMARKLYIWAFCYYLFYNLQSIWKPHSVSPPQIWEKGCPGFSNQLCLQEYQGNVRG